MNRERRTAKNFTPLNKDSASADQILVSTKQRIGCQELIRFNPKHTLDFLRF